MARSQDILTGTFRFEGAARVSEETYRERTLRAEPAYGDLLYSREGTYFGIAAEVPRETRVCLGQRMVLLRPNPIRVHFRFLRYWLNSAVLGAHIHGHRDGTVAERLNLPTIRGVPVPVPPIVQQAAIAKVLGSLDDKVELNRRMNETLETMTSVSFKSWFVHFDPVRAKAEGREPFGLDAATAALFPDSVQDSPLGKIPKGWHSAKLSSVAELVKGVSYRSADLEDSPVALVTLKSVARGGGYREDGLKPYRGQFKDEQRIQQGDVVVAHTDVTQAAEVLGRAARVQEHPNYATLVASLDLVIVRPADDLTSREFLYGLLSQDDYKEYAYGHSNGTTVLHLSHKALPDYSFPLPPGSIRIAFTNMARPLFEQLDANFSQSRTLTSIRNSLLSKLVSGEIQLRDAEGLVGTSI